MLPSQQVIVFIAAIETILGHRLSWLVQPQDCESRQVTTWGKGSLSLVGGTILPVPLCELQINICQVKMLGPCG